MKKKLVLLALLWLTLAIILAACHTAPISLRVQNVNCPCDLLIQWTYESGGVPERPGGPHKLTVTAPASHAIVGPFEYSTGHHIWRATGSCIAPSQGTSDYTSPGGWISYFRCGSDADGNTILVHEIEPFEE